MRRWNGWGDDSYTYPVNPSALAFIEAALGPAVAAARDITLEEAAARVPPSRLKEHPLITTAATDRLLHCAGQSFPDWVAMRTGTVPSFPDGVAYPVSGEDVKELLNYAKNKGAILIPYGGGTSVVGHLSAPKGDRPVLTVDMGRMNRLINLDEKSCLADFQAGVRGPDLENALRPFGYTLGHYPQSFEYSTLGGWVAARSAGQFSLGYGKIDSLFTGGTVETPAGSLILPVIPASAAGPDLRQLILGSEGRAGIITRAVVRVSPLPEKECFQAAFFPGPEEGMSAVRQIARAGIPLCMMRLSLPEETTTNLALAGHGKAIQLLEKWLSIRGAGEGKCMLLFGAAGSGKKVHHSLKMAKEIISQNRGVAVGSRPGKEWLRSRFLVPYLRNNLWEMGYAVDTLETATTWDKVPSTVQSVDNALRHGLKEEGERVHVFTHLSHIYPHGSSIYTTYLFRLDADPEKNLSRWRSLKGAASRAIVEAGATISHQHGVGTDHLTYLESEKGSLGLEVIRSACRSLDPSGIMNTGKMVL